MARQVRGWPASSTPAYSASTVATIDFKGWRIESDPECWTLGQPKIRMNKASEQEIYLAHPTYYPTLADAMNGLLQRELRNSDATTAQEIIGLLKQLRVELAEALRGA